MVEIDRYGEIAVYIRVYFSIFASEYLKEDITNRDNARHSNYT